jgi:SAM-dependent methyltransferase
MSHRIREIAAEYDRRLRGALRDEYYGHSGFFNYGYWQPETRDQAHACLQLMDKLLSYCAMSANPIQGRVLDVGCGLGATTHYLQQKGDATQLVGANISLTQLSHSQQNAPGASFVLMDGARLGFRGASFDHLFCVEAAFEFDNRLAFLIEAHRVLKPGGQLALTDILFRRAAGRIRRRLPAENYVPDMAAYHRLYADAGFTDVQVLDASQTCWGGFRRNVARWGWRKLWAGELPLRIWCIHMLVLLIGSLLIRNYLLVWARKC